MRCTDARTIAGVPIAIGGSAGRVLLGCVVGGTALWLTARGTDPASLRDSLQAARVTPMLGATVLVVATVAVGAERWRRLAYPPRGGGNYRHFVAALVTGQMLNVLLPIRLGEVARIYLISRDQGLPAGRVAATVVAERLLDVIALAVGVSWLLLHLALPEWLRASAGAILGAAAVAIGSVTAIAWRGGKLIGLIEGRVSLVSARAALFLRRYGDFAVEQMRSLLQPANVMVWWLTAALVVLAAATNWVLFQAFELPLSASVALLLFVALQVGGIPVATPGNVGVVHLLTVWILTAFGVDRAVALAYAVVLHLIASGSKVIAGVALLMVRRSAAAPIV